MLCACTSRFACGCKLCGSALYALVGQNSRVLLACTVIGKTGLYCVCMYACYTMAHFTFVGTVSLQDKNVLYTVFAYMRAFIAHSTCVSILL